jgi:hypothetical protein
LTLIRTSQKHRADHQGCVTILDAGITNVGATPPLKIRLKTGNQSGTFKTTLCTSNNSSDPSELVSTPLIADMAAFDLTHRHWPDYSQRLSLRRTAPSTSMIFSIASMRLMPRFRGASRAS